MIPKHAYINKHARFLSALKYISYNNNLRYVSVFFLSFRLILRGFLPSNRTDNLIHPKGESYQS